MADRQFVLNGVLNSQNKYVKTEVKQSTSALLDFYSFEFVGWC